MDKGQEQVVDRPPQKCPNGSSTSENVSNLKKQ